jgi:hypothetical protein
MADRKISDLTALTTPASGDFLPIVDISEAAAASKNKRITIEELMRGVPDGTAAAPGIAFETDPNTGIYRPGADQLAVATNGTGRLFVDASGNVGINTASTIAPGGFGYAREFALTGATSGDSSISVNLRGSRTIPGGFADINFWHQSTANRAYIQARRGSSDSAIDLDFITSGGAGMRITSAGLVGVGTSAPGQKLEIAGETNPIIRITPNGQGDSWSTSAEYGKVQFWNTDFEYGGGGEMASISAGVNTVYGGHGYLKLLAGSNGSMRFWTNGSERVRIDSSGRVGIGTTSPKATRMYLFWRSSALSKH